MANLVFDFLHSYETGERRESEPANAYQYDEGHVLEAVLPEAVTSCEIHYWIRGQEKSEAYTPGSITQNDDGSCTVIGNIPNLYFETNGELRVYIVVTDGSASITTYEGYVHICQRSMPDDYVDDDPENEATRVLTEAQEAAATATAAAETCEEVLESIPEDYSTLSNDVEDLQDDFDDLDDRITALEQGGSGSGLTEDIKQALLQIAEKVAYVDAHGQDYYDDLYDALYAITAITINAQSIMLTSIGSTQQLTATTTPEGGAVTWASSNTSVATVNSAGLVTSTGYGSCTITATSGSVSASCAVAVSQVTLTSIVADYQQSGTVYDTASLDSLKSDLTVIATYSDSSTATVTEYTLSGTLTVGTSTVTVSYGGKTTTFNVTVSQLPCTWRYSASSGDLLSEESYFESVTIGKTCTEELTGGVLKLTSLKNNQQDAIRYYLTPTTNIYAAIKFRIRYVEIPIATGASGFRVVLSDGSKGLRIGVRKNASDGKYKLTARAGSTDTDIAEIELNTWYEISLEKNGQNTIVTLDGTEVYNSNTPSTSYTTENQIFNQSTNATNSVVDIDYIEYCNYDTEE